MTERQTIKDKARERELFQQAWDKIQRESHSMPADVPYWVEDLLEYTVAILNVLWRNAVRFGFLASIGCSLYEIYAALNGLRMMSILEMFRMITEFAINGALLGLPFWGVIRVFKRRVNGQA